MTRGFGTVSCSRCVCKAHNEEIPSNSAWKRLGEREVEGGVLDSLLRSCRYPGDQGSRGVGREFGGMSE